MTRKSPEAMHPVAVLVLSAMFTFHCLLIALLCVWRDKTYEGVVLVAMVLTLWISYIGDRPTPLQIIFRRTGPDLRPPKSR